MLHVHSPLSEEVEQLIQRTIGCCIAVHRTLGPGLLETICARATCLELESCGISLEAEKRIPVFYRGKLLCHQRLDIKESSSSCFVSSWFRFSPCLDVVLDSLPLSLELIERHAIQPAS